MRKLFFEKIINGEIPSTKVYEDDHFLVIQDIQQNTKGHSLIIPKEHSEDILDMNTNLGNELISVIQKVGLAMIKGLGAVGFNTIINTKPGAGQVIFHTHIHIIPRYEGDGLKFWPHIETTDEDRVNFAAKIISALEE